MKALENYQAAILYQDKTGSYLEMGYSFHQIGRTCLDQEDWESALDSLHIAIQCADKASHNELFGVSYYLIGMIYQKQQVWEKALKNYDAARAWYEHIGNIVESANSCHQMGRVCEELSKYDDAADAYLLGFMRSVKLEEMNLSILNLNGLVRIAPRVSEESIDKAKRILPEIFFNEIFKE